MARALVAKGVNINVYGNGQSPLCSAIYYSNNDVALLLLELGADPNFSNLSKWTPLHFACVKGLVDVAQVLIAKGASQDAVNSEGKTPLDIAVERQNREIVALFEAQL